MQKMVWGILLPILLLNSCIGQPEVNKTSDSAPDTEKVIKTSETYFAGDGGKGISLAVLLPTEQGLAPDEQWLPSYIQGSITGDFNRFSAMTVIDHYNIEKIIDNQAFSVSGFFSDNDFIRIGHLVNARYILTGSITKASTSYVIEFAVTEAESGIRRASYSPRQAAQTEISSLSAIKEAVADLLDQLGVTLTDKGAQELKTPVNNTHLQAEEALAKGHAARREGNEVAALIFFDHAIELDRNLGDAYLWRGILHNHSGNFDRAIADFTQYIKFKQNIGVVYGLRGLAYYKKGDYNRAIENYTQAIKLDKDDASSYTIRGLAYYEKEDYNRAIADYTQVLRLKPNDITIYALRGNAYFSKSDYDHAIADYTQYINSEQNDAQYYYYRGISYLATKKYSRGIADLETAVKINPNNTQYKKNLEEFRKLQRK